MTTSAKGDLGVAKVLAAFSSKGVPVLIPWGNSQRYDLVVDIFGHLVRVQVKTGTVSGKQTMVFNSCSSSGDRTSKHYRDEIDIFGVYAPATDGVYIMPTKEATSTKTAICLGTRSSSYSGFTRYSCDYEFDVYWKHLLIAAGPGAKLDEPADNPQILKFLCGVQ